jgi:hypothetical protein
LINIPKGCVGTRAEEPRPGDDGDFPQISERPGEVFLRPFLTKNHWWDVKLFDNIRGLVFTEFIEI